MPEPLTCPGCFSLNKPTASRCRVCGRRLVESRRSKRKSGPVVLQRVMSGEIFAAVLQDGSVGGPSIVRDLERERAELRKEAADLEEYRKSLATYEARLRASAEGAGQKYEPYARTRKRRWNRTHPAEQAEKIVDSAMTSFREKKFPETVERLQGAIRVYDGDPRAWILLGESQLRLGRPYEAGAAFLRTLSLNPKDERGWLGLAKALRATEDLTGALEGADRAVGINPGFVEGWMERGVILEALKDFAEALQSFAKVLELRPGHPAARVRRSEVEEKLLRKARAAELEAAPPAESAGPSIGSPPGTQVAEAPAATGTPPVAEDVDAILGLRDLPVPAKPAPAPEPEEAAGEPAEARAGPTRERPVEAVVRPVRVKTFVEGLDEFLGGGIPWGHVVLIQGTPGTMKSSLGFWILLNNAVREGLHCLYITLEERAESLLKQMLSMGFPLNVTKGSLVFLDPRTAKHLLGEKADWVPCLERGLEAVKRERGLDLIVIDSLEALEVLAKFRERRREMYRLFEWLRDMDVTSFVITERPEWVVGRHVLQGRWDEDFLADGLIQLRLHPVSDLDVQRRLRVVKMRGTRHEPGYLALVADESRLKVVRAMSP